MFFKRKLFGYSAKDVDDIIEAYQRQIELQRRDIEFLKKDNMALKECLNEYSRTDK